MLALMVIYTVPSLWIIAQPIFDLFVKTPRQPGARWG